jgi:hypothetical protein
VWGLDAIGKTLRRAVWASEIGPFIDVDGVWEIAIAGKPAPTGFSGVDKIGVH